MKNNSIIFKKVKFTFYSPVSVKIEYSPTGKFINKELFVTEINDTKYIKPEIKRGTNSIIILTENLKIYYKETSDGLSPKNLKIWYKFNNTYKRWCYGQKDHKNLGGSSLDLFKYPKIRGKKLSTGVLSKNGYYVYEDFTYVFWEKDRQWAVQQFIPGYKTLFFIGYGKDYKLGLKEFSKIFGKIPMIPVWAFGFWYSRYYAYHQKEFLDLVDKYRKLNIPIDVMVVDTDWRKNVWRGYDWAEKYFPAPDKFIKQMKKRGIKLTLNDHPGYNSSEILPKDDSHLKKIYKFLGIKSDKEWRCNWGDKKSVKAFCEILIKPKLKQGIDFWWIDGWGADGIYKNEEFFKKYKDVDKMALGVDGYKTLNPQLWLNFFYYKTTTEVHRKKRPLILSRWGGIGSHRYPVWFSGDTYSTWKTLAYQVYFTYTAGNVLTNYWSHDLGGFLGRKIPKDLFLRWIQFGAFSPIMRTHSDHGIREPWKFDKETVEIFRKYVRLRYRLVPYFYKLSFESYKFASPLIRAMYYEYPFDKNSYKFKYQYLLGQDILVAPVVKRKNTKKIFFPEGEWLGIEIPENIKGAVIKKFDVPLNIIPAFIKKGSIIPIAQEMKYIGEKDNKVLQFEIFPDNNETEFEYYEDDGISLDYQKGKYLIIPIKVQKKEKELILIIGKQKGAYKKMPRKRKINIIFHFTENIKPRNAFLNKTKIKITKEDRLFGEIKSRFNSYKIIFNYRGNLTKVLITF